MSLIVSRIKRFGRWPVTSPVSHLTGVVLDRLAIGGRDKEMFVGDKVGDELGEFDVASLAGLRPFLGAAGTAPGSCLAREVHIVWWLNGTRVWECRSRDGRERVYDWRHVDGDHGPG
jgi:hypothetical protein